jgi:hypothetical protein
MSVDGTIMVQQYEKEELEKFQHHPPKRYVQDRNGRDNSLPFFDIPIIRKPDVLLALACTASHVNMISWARQA